MLNVSKIFKKIYKLLLIAIIINIPEDPCTFSDSLDGDIAYVNIGFKVIDKSTNNNNNNNNKNNNNLYI